MWQVKNVTNLINQICDYSSSKKIQALCWRVFIELQFNFSNILQLARKTSKMDKNKIRPLAMNRRILAWLGAYSLDETAGTCKKFAYILFTFIIFLVSVCALSSSAIFFGQYVSVSLEDSLYALFQICAYLSMGYVIIITPFLRQKIKMILKTLTEIHKSSKRFFFSFSNVNSKVFFY